MGGKGKGGGKGGHHHHGHHHHGHHHHGHHHHHEEHHHHHHGHHHHRRTERFSRHSRFHTAHHSHHVHHGSHRDIPGVPAVPTLVLQDVTYSVKIVFGEAIGVDATGDGVANFHGAELDTAAGAVVVVGTAVDTDKDGVADAVGIDTDNDGKIDTYVDLDLPGQDEDIIRATVRLVAIGQLQLSLPDRATITLDMVADAVESFADDLAMKQMTANGNIKDSDFDISGIKIGSIDAVKTIDSGMDEGDWTVDSDRTGMGGIPIAADFGEVLRSSGDMLQIRGQNKLVIEGAPNAPNSSACCVML